MPNFSLIEAAGAAGEALGRFGQVSIGRRGFFRAVAAGGAVVAGLGETVAHAEFGRPSISKYRSMEKPGVTIVEATLEHGQGLLIGGAPFTTGSMRYMGIELGSKCVPYAGVFVADRTHRVMAEVTGEVHAKGFFVGDLTFEELASNAEDDSAPIWQALTRAVRIINEETFEDASNFVPATHIFGGLVTQDDGNPQFYPVIRRRWVNARMQRVAEPPDCPPGVGARGTPCPPDQIATWPPDADTREGHNIELTAGPGDIYHANLYWPKRRDSNAFFGAEVSTVFRGESYTALNAAGTVFKYRESCINFEQVVAEAQAHLARRIATGENVAGLISPQDLIRNGLAENRRERLTGAVKGQVSGSCDRAAESPPFPNPGPLGVPGNSIAELFFPDDGNKVDEGRVVRVYIPQGGVNLRKAGGKFWNYGGCDPGRVIAEMNSEAGRAGIRVITVDVLRAAGLLQ